MENLVREAGPVEVHTPRRSFRALTIFAALTLVLGGVVLARASDPDRPKTDVVTNVDGGEAVVDGTGAVLGRALGFGAPVNAQVNVGDLIQAIVCPILNALATGPFGAFIGPVINSLRAAFGCVSPG